MIHYDFTRTYNNMVFSDCLCLPDDHEYTEEEITAMQDQRFNNWLDRAILNPPIVHVPHEIEEEVEDNG